MRISAQREQIKLQEAIVNAAHETAASLSELARHRSVSHAEMWTARLASHTEKRTLQKDKHRLEYAEFDLKILKLRQEVDPNFIDYVVTPVE